MKPAPQARTSLWRGWGLLVLALLLGACGRDRDSRRDAPLQVPLRAAAIRHAAAGEVTVARGDTLYGIAFRNGMDFRELAAINGIAPPYTIYVGQTLRLREGPRRQRPPAVVRQPTPRPPPRRPAMVGPVPDAQTSVATLHEPTPTPFEEVPRPVVAPAAAEARTTTAPAPPRGRELASVRPASPAARPAPEAVAPGPTADADTGPRTPSAAILPADVATVGGVRWRWPAAGSLLARFMPGDATRQGIDIAGHAGDPVVAAADGVVVYSGSGLVGYGELVIIKHSDEWLSAYGHNRRRLVQEGQRVRGGQVIAEMGNSGASRDELHFEIRRNGRPVDPQQYLPAR